MHQTRTMIALLVLNAIAAAISVVFAVIALVRPAVLSRSEGRSVTAGERLFARMYAVRSIPLGLAVAIVPFVADGFSTAIIVLIGGLVQLADGGVLFTRREPFRSLPPVIAGLLHGALAVVLLGAG
jgi:hypothetical protein